MPCHRGGLPCRFCALRVLPCAALRSTRACPAMLVSRDVQCCRSGLVSILLPKGRSTPPPSPCPPPDELFIPAGVPHSTKNVAAVPSTWYYVSAALSAHCFIAIALLLRAGHPFVVFIITASTPAAVGCFLAAGLRRRRQQLVLSHRGGASSLAALAEPQASTCTTTVAICSRPFRLGVPSLYSAQLPLASSFVSFDLPLGATTWP